MVVAIKFLEKCSVDNIDVFVRNFLLESYGVGLVFYEFMFLFVVLYGVVIVKL